MSVEVAQNLSGVRVLHDIHDRGVTTGEEQARELAKGWQYAGYRMTVFSRSEEEFAEDNVFKAKLYFNMPDALEAAGGTVVTTDENFTPYVVSDRELITAQNPMSDHALAEAFLAALDATA